MELAINTAGPRAETPLRHHHTICLPTTLENGADSPLLNISFHLPLHVLTKKKEDVYALSLSLLPSVARLVCVCLVFSHLVAEQSRCSVR